LISGYIIQLTTPLIYVGGSFINIKRDLEALCRLNAFTTLDAIKTPTGKTAKISSAIIFSGTNMAVVINGKPIIAGLNFNIHKGDFAVITGDSGVGKTSLLKTLLGLQATHPGTLFFGGVDITELAIGDITAHCAVVMQQPVVFTGTLRDNLSYGCSTPVSDEKLMEIILFLQLDELMHNSSGNQMLASRITPELPLSGGEKQRIAIGRALARQKEILVLDEPTSALDLTIAMKILRRLKQQGMTVIMVTHQPAFCAIADTVIRLPTGD